MAPGTGHNATEGVSTHSAWSLGGMVVRRIDETGLPLQTVALQGGPKDARRAGLGEWPVAQGGVGHLLEFVAADTARGLYGDAVGEGGEVARQ
ncbi:hypothetical protein [Streptomyces sp. NPDC059743]|uniref:hypothetical protein n=1 Tax=Streptomyces sp. NPDC059743 TaxID=3346928 RepID=UPI0036598CD5